MEINFRTYINEKGLSEESYKVASTEYSEAIKPLKEKIMNVENQLAEITGLLIVYLGVVPLQKKAILKYAV